MEHVAALAYCTGVRGLARALERYVWEMVELGR